MSETIRTIGDTGNARGLLSFAGAHLVLAPGDLRIIAAPGDVVRTDPPARGIGWIAMLEQWRPVYALSFDLAPVVDEAAAARPMCAVLGHGSALYALLCDDIQIMRGAGPVFRPLAPSMQAPGLPIRDLALDARGLLCGTDANRLGRCIGVAIRGDQAPARVGRAGVEA
ncbi:hypothetical protein [uncultured Thiodictyon sp.]|uniref:hypothetical protein n=1 Tax=uncultured Thiodictyon sp. TaxID=1846217 RepID=UPI0025F33D08|nr:hypothetical protein [uncultured Thiodictyon sp.]